VPLHPGIFLTRRDLGSQLIAPKTVPLYGSGQTLAFTLRRQEGLIRRLLVRRDVIVSYCQTLGDH
jgi:hypothetical protein